MLRVYVSLLGFSKSTKRRIASRIEEIWWIHCCWTVREVQGTLYCHRKKNPIPGLCCETPLVLYELFPKIKEGRLNNCMSAWIDKNRKGFFSIGCLDREVGSLQKWETPQNSLQNDIRKIIPLSWGLALLLDNHLKGKKFFSNEDILTVIRILQKKDFVATGPHQIKNGNIFIQIFFKRKKPERTPPNNNWKLHNKFSV